LRGFPLGYPCRRFAWRLFIRHIFGAFSLASGNVKPFAGWWYIDLNFAPAAAILPAGAFLFAPQPSARARGIEGCASTSALPSTISDKKFSIHIL
jgi:hypothetical protein